MQRVLLWLAMAWLWIGQSGATGSLEFVARVTPTAGRAEPVRGLTFYLLTKSFSDIQKQAQEATKPPSRDEFLDRLQVSPQLKAWMKRTGRLSLNGPELVQRLTASDILEVPEFLDAYLARNAGDLTINFPKPKHREQDREANPQKYDRQRKEYLDKIRRVVETYPHTKEGLDVYLASVDPGQRWLQEQAEYRRHVRRQTLELAQTRYRIGEAETNLEGRGEFRNVPAGIHWLATLEGEATAGDVRLRWDLPVEIRAGETVRVELTNFNAVLPERSRPSRTLEDPAPRAASREAR